MNDNNNDNQDKGKMAQSPSEKQAKKSSVSAECQPQSDLESKAQDNHSKKRSKKKGKNKGKREIIFNGSTLSQQFADMLLRIKLGYDIPIVTANSAKILVDAWELGNGLGLGYSHSQRLPGFFPDSFYQEISNKFKSLGEQYASIKTGVEKKLSRTRWDNEPGSQEEQADHEYEQPGLQKQQAVLDHQVIAGLQDEEAKKIARLSSQMQSLGASDIQVKYMTFSQSHNIKQLKKEKLKFIKKHIVGQFNIILCLGADSEPFFEVGYKKYCSYVDFLKGSFLFRFAHVFLSIENSSLATDLLYINQLARNVEFYFEFYINPRTDLLSPEYKGKSWDSIKEMREYMQENLARLEKDFEQVEPLLKLYIAIAKSIHQSIRDNDPNFSQTKAILGEKENQKIIEKSRKNLILKLFVKLKERLTKNQHEKAYEIFEQLKKSNFDDRRIFSKSSYVTILHDLASKLYLANEFKKANTVFGVIPDRLSSVDQCGVFKQQTLPVSLKEYNSAQYHLGLIKLKQAEEVLKTKADQNDNESKLDDSLSGVKEQLEQSRNYFANVAKDSDFYSQSQQKITEIESLAKQYNIDLEDVAKLALN